MESGQESEHCSVSLVPGLLYVRVKILLSGMLVTLGTISKLFLSGTDKRSSLESGCASTIKEGVPQTKTGSAQLLVGANGQDGFEAFCGEPRVAYAIWTSRTEDVGDVIKAGKR